MGSMAFKMSDMSTVGVAEMPDRIRSHNENVIIVAVNILIDWYKTGVQIQIQEHTAISTIINADGRMPGV